MIEELCCEMGLQHPEAFEEYILFVVTDRGEGLVGTGWPCMVGTMHDGYCVWWILCIVGALYGGCHIWWVRCMEDTVHGGCYA